MRGRNQSWGGAGGGRQVPSGCVRVAAPGKINLRLRIVGRRPDGYHLLDSMVLPIDLFDHVGVRVLAARRPGVELSLEGAGVPEGDDNLAVRAAYLFMRRAQVCGQVLIALEKNIPTGAGLGGGSSDAAAVLLCLNMLFDAKLERARLMDWGLQLGADVPFFLFGRPARMQGIGERLEELPSWPRPAVVVVFAGASLGTDRVYAAYDSSLTSTGPASSMRTSAPGRAGLPELLENDLEAAAIRIQPRVHWLKRRLLEHGAQGALMTGSGSAVFGLWEHPDEAREVAKRMRGEGVWARAARVLDRAPEVRMSDEQ